MSHQPHLIIVGSGTGISLHTALRFGKEGFRVSLLARNLKSLKERVGTLEDNQVQVSYYQADASDFEGLKKTLLTAIHEWGTPAAVLYNAAALHPGDPMDQSPDAFVEDFKVNIAGAIATVQAVAPFLEKAKGGTILFTGGGLSKTPAAKYASLSIGKAGIWSLAQTFSQVLSPKGIKVATITVSVYVNEEHARTIGNLYWEIHHSDWNEVEMVYGE